MDEAKKLTLKDGAATSIGGGLGLEYLYSTVQDLLTNGATGDEWLALARCAGLIVFGFMSWKQPS